MTHEVTRAKDEKSERLRAGSHDGTLSPGPRARVGTRGPARWNGTLSPGPRARVGTRGPARRGKSGRCIFVQFYINSTDRVMDFE